MKEKIKLIEVDKQNWVDCINLSLSVHQEGYLASNVATIAESKFESHYNLRAITFNDKVIGMLAFCKDLEILETPVFWLFRFMIDKQFQGKGLGNIALNLVIKEIQGLGAQKILTMCKPENSGAFHLYKKNGFKFAGLLEDGDSLLEKRL